MKSEPLRIDWTRLPVRYVPLALLLFPIVLHVAMVPVAVAYEGHLPWADWLTPQADGLYHSPPDRGWGALTFGGLVVRMALNALVGVIVVSAMALFEEVGWRAWLQPRLVNRLGVRRGIAVTSLIWAFWHIPFYLSGIQHIDGVSPQQLALVAPLGTFAGGLILRMVVGDDGEHLDRFACARRAQQPRPVPPSNTCISSGRPTSSSCAPEPSVFSLSGCCC